MAIIGLFILRCMAYGYAIQPRWLQLFWGNLLGLLLMKLKFRAKVVEQNLKYAFPNDPAEQKKVFRESYLHFGNLVCETLLLVGPMKRFIFKYGRVLGANHILEAREKGKGVIFLASHLGNWEIMGAAGALLGEAQLMFVTKKVKPAWLHAAIEKGRSECLVDATYEPKTLKDILSQLKKNRSIGFVLDQYAGAPVGVRVPFFGIPVGTTLAVATIIKRTGATVLPVINYRSPDGRWTIDIQPPLPWITHPGSDQDSKLAHRELVENTAHFVSLIEKSIYEHPAQWLWTHRRFKGDLGPIRDDEWNEPRARR